MTPPTRPTRYLTDGCTFAVPWVPAYERRPLYEGCAAVKIGELPARGIFTAKLLQSVV